MNYLSAIKEKGIFCSEDIKDNPCRIFFEKGGRAVKIIVHYPTSENGCEELARRVAEIHATATMQYIESLPCSKVQKLAMLDAIIQEKRQGKLRE